MYEVTFTRDQRKVTHVGLTRATAQALADYLAHTFGIIPTIRQGA